MIYLKQEIKQELATIVDGILGMKAPFEFDVHYNDEQFGDIGTNILLKSGPYRGRLEASLPIELGKSELFKRIVHETKIVHPGFVNFYFKPSFYCAYMLALLDGSSSKEFKKTGKGKTVLVEYSSPNIAKRMHIGHIRSTIIGAALYNLYKVAGFTTIGDNHIGDWGTGFGQLLVQYKKRYGTKAKKGLTIVELEELYVEFQKEVEHSPELQDLAREEIRKLHEGNKENTALWKYFVKISVADLARLYKLLGVKFDTQHGESYYRPYIEKALNMAKECGVARIDQGALVAFNDNMPPLILQKQDGAYLYSTTDVATLYYRQKTYKPYRMLYVVSNDQTLYFEQLFCTAQKMSILQPNQAYHVKFGSVLGIDKKKFSTRKGGAVPLEEVIDEAVKKAKSHTIGLAALKYNDLSQTRVKDITFDWEKMLAMEGDSAPYLLYTFARFRSILEKSGVAGSLVKSKRLPRNIRQHIERATYDTTRMMKDLTSAVPLFQHIIMYFDVLTESRETMHPHILANYLYELSTAANHFYQKVPIITEGNEVIKSLYLLVSYSVLTIISDGLSILGIDVLDRM